MHYIKSYILFIYLIYISLFNLISAIESSLSETGNSTDQENSSKTEEILHLRKCCPELTYFSTITNDCQPDTNGYFKGHINKHLYPAASLLHSTITGKIEACPESLNPPLIYNFPTHFSHSLFQNGSLVDIESNHSYDTNHYCLEVVGSKAEEATLILVHCPGIRNSIHKCCPFNHYFDSRNFGCSPYYFVEGTEGDDAIAPFLASDQHLTYEYELTCEDPPVKINLLDGLIHQDQLCVDSMDYCYPPNMFCIDNMLSDDESTLVPSAFVCPVHFVNKCCPEDQILNSSGCGNATKVSPFLRHIVENTRYHTKNLNEFKSICTPLLIEDSEASNISWELDFKGSVVVKKKNINITSTNYCVDDYVTDDQVFPVLKICSEEFQEYNEVSSIDHWPANVVGKCCPLNMMYQSSTGEEGSCVLPKANRTIPLNNFNKSILDKFNLTHLLFSNFPTCSGSYHLYPMGNQLRNLSVDHAEITAGRDVTIVSIERKRCRSRETKVALGNYCVETMASDDGEMLPIVIICSENLEEKHVERNPIIISLVLLSCLALSMALFTLIWTRVRRGMVTVKKVNTLAGRLLVSYVSCQLIGFLTLSVGMIVDFGQDSNSCFILAGVLMFSLISAFCWNTSICLEGLLLTLHIQVSERRRFICHVIWAIGLPSTIASLALIRDSKRDELACDAITPKIGDQRCFFSDTLAQLLYFYVPISITVVLNAVLLITAKVLRKKKLRELEKDPNRIRRHGTLQKVFTISVRTRERMKKEKSSTSKPPDPSHSGLRTHQNRNLWLESSKLVLWSGGTWLMEIIGTLVTLYAGPSQGKWYDYLWYLPVGFNSLRGIGIFMIISLTSENKKKFNRTFTVLGSSLNRTFASYVSAKSFRSNKTIKRKNTSQNFAKTNSNNNFTNASNNFKNSINSSNFGNSSNGSISREAEGYNRKPRVSISTVVTDLSMLSSERRKSENSLATSARIPGFYRSISEAHHFRELSEVSENNEDGSDVYSNVSSNVDDVFGGDEESYCTHF